MWACTIHVELLVLRLACWVKNSADDILKYVSYFPQKQILTYHANCLHLRQFAWTVKSCFLGGGGGGGDKKNIISLSSAESDHRELKIV